MKTLDIKVTGTHCPSCSMLVEMTLDDLEGVEAASCDHASGRTTVTFDETKLDEARLTEAVQAAGYGASVVTTPEGASR
jgi:Cu+-exporting ATPase